MSIDWTKSTNVQGDGIQRQVSQAGLSNAERAELDRMNQENAEAARTAQSR